MISLKRFLDDKPRERVEALERVVQLLLQGISLHSIQGAPEDYAAFQSNIQEVFESIKTAKDSKDYLVLGGSAIRTIEDYQRRTVRYFSRMRAEMQRMIGMLTGSLSAVSEASNENLRRLRDIENQVAEAAELDDVRQVKARLSECLEDIRRERERQKARASKTVADLNEALDSARAGASAAGVNSGHSNSEVDAVTGLPDGRAAEAAIVRECLLQRPSHLVLITLDNLSAVTLRYGSDVGDKVLQSFGDHIAQLLAPEDELFHWHGPALVVLSRGPERPDRIRERFGRILEKKFEYSIQTSSRDAVLSLTTRWAVLPVGSTAEAMLRKIDQFLTPADAASVSRGKALEPAC